jgi:peptidoglycan/LPS O-acetylase OafA/YrhL
MQKNHKLGYRPDIEGLRALAILLVVAAHMNLPGFQGGFIGVDMFFVLSGYLITALLVLEMQATGRVDMWGFYARRLRRLAPGLFLVVLASCLLAWALLRPAHQATQVNAAASALVWLSNFFYAFSEIGYFEPGAENSLFLHTWSLGVEEQFYLVWPWLLLLAFWWAQKRQAAKATPDDGAQDRARYWKRMMWLVFALSLALCLILMRLHPASAFYMMPARAWQFALGALTWLYFRDRSAGGVLSPPAAPKGRMLTELCGWLGLAAIALALLWCSPDAPYPGYRALLPSLGAALLLAAGSRAKHGGGGYNPVPALPAAHAGAGARLLFLVPVALADSGAGHGGLHQRLAGGQNRAGAFRAAAGLHFVLLRGAANTPPGGAASPPRAHGGGRHDHSGFGQPALPALVFRDRSRNVRSRKPENHGCQLGYAPYPGLRRLVQERRRQRMHIWRSERAAQRGFAGRQHWHAVVSRAGETVYPAWLEAFCLDQIGLPDGRQTGVFLRAHWPGLHRMRALAGKCHKTAASAAHGHHHSGFFP